MIKAMIAYLGIGVVLGAGIFLMIKGSLWLLVLGLLVYFFLFVKYGCLSSQQVTECLDSRKGREGKPACGSASIQSCDALEPRLLRHGVRPLASR